MANCNCAFCVDIEISRESRPDFHTHPCTELIWFRRGVGRLCTESGELPYREGMLGIYQPGSRHADRPLADGVQRCVGVSGAAASGLPVGVWPGSAAIESGFARLAEAARCAAPDQATRMDLLAGLLTLDIASALMSAPSQPCASERDYPALARQELEAHFAEAYHLDRLAQKLFISKSYMRQLFREQYGESPLAYLLRRKIEFACELLKMTDLPVKDVAHRVGIDNVYYFATLFARKIKCSPTVYRARSRKE